VVPLAPGGKGHHRNVAPSLQRCPAAQQPELLDAARVQAAASPRHQPSRPPRMIGPNFQGQVRWATSVSRRLAGRQVADGGRVKPPGAAGAIQHVV